MFFVIRVRGSTGVIADIKDTLDLLNLTRISHAVLVEENPSMKGMLQKAKDYLTWGEIDAETLTEIIEKRGKLVGGDKVTEEYLKENTDFSSFEELANALINAEIKAKDINMKPVFRLHPPRKGYESIRLTYNEGGTLGYRGEEIIDLAKRMS
ncbi:MAG: 50S ribosomal protein L30 [Methanobacteriaceae archaeon]|jgi:large subunit ribosomal protein L30|uniref:50S ribosomal protein L30 n=1 Tax=Methanobrevibacter TaxID=2172 RepID=UPI002A16334E|nr:50S ribosomal protein L30 [Methanobacteriaceae archaeon]MDD3408113.1 50S ribosomal protein L30 [Methanobacteriaceae archaeon]MDD4593874.1 50S ribosomal protein L30 [Methanobacteriaceae archaeon]